MDKSEFGVWSSEEQSGTPTASCKRKALDANLLSPWLDESPVVKENLIECPQRHDPAQKYDPKLAGKKRMRNNAKKKGGEKQRLVLEGSNIKYTYKNVCGVCPCESTGCKHIDFQTIKNLREDLYGEGSTQESRKRWRFAELLRCYEKTVAEKAKKNISMKAGLLLYHIPGRFTAKGKDIPVCRNCYEAILAVASDTLDNTRRLIVNEGVRAETSSVGPPKVRNESDERLFVSAWIEMYVQSLTCYSPDEKRHELPGNMSLQGMWEQFCKDWKEGVMNGSYHRKNFGRLAREKRSDETPPGYDLFRKVWKKDFDDKIKIPRHHKRFPICNWCARLEMMMVKAKTHEERVFWRAELYAHYLWVTQNRKKYYRHREKAMKNPSK